MLKRKVVYRGKEYIIDIDRRGNLIVDGKRVKSRVVSEIGNFYKVDVDGESFSVEVIKDQILVDGEVMTAEVKPFVSSLPKAQAGGMTSKRVIKAPIPGRVTEIMVRQNSRVKKDQELLILEAMKMRNRILSPITGKVARLAVKEDETVGQDQVLIEIIPK